MQCEQLPWTKPFEPRPGHGMVRLLADMSKAEIAELEARYGCKVKLRDPNRVVALLYHRQLAEDRFMFRTRTSHTRVLAPELIQRNDVQAKRLYVTWAVAVEHRLLAFRIGKKA